MFGWDGGRRLQVGKSLVSKDEQIQEGTHAGTMRGTWPARDEVEIRRSLTDAPLTKVDVQRAYDAAGYEWPLVDVVKISGVIHAVVQKDGGYAAIPASVEGSQYDAMLFDIENMQPMRSPMVDGREAFGVFDTDPDRDDIIPGENPASGEPTRFRHDEWSGRSSGGGYRPTAPGRNPANGAPAPTALQKVTKMDDIPDGACDGFVYSPGNRRSRA